MGEGQPGCLRTATSVEFRHLQDTWPPILAQVVLIGPLRSWIFLWLISSAGLLWSTFLLAQGGWLWVSVWLVLAILGSNILVFLMRFG